MVVVVLVVVLLVELVLDELVVVGGRVVVVVGCTVVVLVGCTVVVVVGRTVVVVVVVVVVGGRFLALAGELPTGETVTRAARVVTSTARPGAVFITGRQRTGGRPPLPVVIEDPLGWDPRAIGRIGGNLSQHPRPTTLDDGAAGR